MKKRISPLRPGGRTLRPDKNFSREGLPAVRFGPPEHQEVWDRQEVVGMLSHDLRTPLNGVVGFLDLLADTSLDAEQRDYLETARNSASFLHQILHSLLEDLKTEALGCVPHFEPCRIEDILRPLFESHRRLATDIDFSLHIAPEIGGVWLTDRVKWGQILTNLLSNAIKFSPGGAITVNARAAKTFPSGFQIAVEDSGSGIPKGHLKKVVEAFHQARTGEAAHPDGTGLGLTIVRKLVGVLRGTLEISSRENLGTTVCVEVPAQRVKG